MIAFLGMGLLGSNFVRALRKRGVDVQVWNRTPERAKTLEADGAKAFANVADAVRGATRVHLTLSDDAAVDAVLEQARLGLDPKAILIDHTTTSPKGTAERAKRWAERGIAFQHAPVFMGPQNALESTGVMMASGPKEQFDLLAPELSKMTGSLKYLGAAPERAAAFKLLGNCFLLFMTDGLIEMLTLAKSVGISPSEAGSLFEFFNPGGSIPFRLKRLLQADFGNPSWELAMARKDARLMIEAAQAGNLPLPVLPALAAEMDRWIEKGHAHDDWMVIARRALQG